MPPTVQCPGPGATSCWTPLSNWWCKGIFQSPISAKIYLMLPLKYRFEHWNTFGNSCNDMALACGFSELKLVRNCILDKQVHRTAATFQTIFPRPYHLKTFETIQSVKLPCNTLFRASSCYVFSYEYYLWNHTGFISKNNQKVKFIFHQKWFSAE